MGKTKKSIEETSIKKRKTKPASTPEGRENQLVALAYDLLEQRLRDGTATSQEVTTLIKYGSPKGRLEKEILEQQKELMAAKTEALHTAKHIDELYTNAINAMRTYSGLGVENEENVQ